MAQRVGQPRERDRRCKPGRYRENDETNRAPLCRPGGKELTIRFSPARQRRMKGLVLPPLSALYGAVTRTRLALYQRGTFHTTKLERPVISVGNITAGGTGKTPLVEWISKTIAAQGKNVCILTRGYGREHPQRQVVVSDGHTIIATPAEAGDEPSLLATKLLKSAAVISNI